VSSLSLLNTGHCAEGNEWRGILGTTGLQDETSAIECMSWVQSAMRVQRKEVVSEEFNVPVRVGVISSGGEINGENCCIDLHGTSVAHRNIPNSVESA